MHSASVVERNRPGLVFTFAIFLTAILSLAAQAESNLPDRANVLLPQPKSLASTQGSLSMAAGWRVQESIQSDRLHRAVLRALHQMSDRTGLAFSAAENAATSLPLLKLSIDGEGEPVQSVDEDESYDLVVGPEGVVIHATTVAGGMHGLQTMLQLLQADGAEYKIPYVRIQDSPRFPWRGLMIDCVRHFESVAEIKRTLDGMAAVKLNVFHWHLIDDQGFRIESRRFPKLTLLGSDGFFYSQSDARDIVRYARDRGIRVVPEFEMPGHSTAWLVAYPELSSGRPPEGIRRAFGISDAALDPTREETYRFITTFLSEMAGIFPDTYVHIGGDETAAPDWKTDTRILTFMRVHNLSDSDALQAYFNRRVLGILTSLHKRMIGWDEVLNPALPRTVIVQSWRGEESLVRGAKQGYQGILSAPYYLDAMKSAGEHYLADPLPSTADLTSRERRLILGGEVCMWAEQLDERTIDSRVWPRTAAIAERFWSPEQVRDVADMYRRLEPTSIELESLGLRHLSQEGIGLRQLANAADIDSLWVFATVFEPVSFSERYKQQKTSQHTVLDRFVDAVRPDPPSRREFQILVDTYLKDPQRQVAARQALLARFAALRQSIPQVKREMRDAPRLQDIGTRADQLDSLAEAGSEAVEHLATGAPVTASWKVEKLTLLRNAEEPSGIVRFTILEPLRELISKASEN